MSASMLAVYVAMKHKKTNNTVHFDIISRKECKKVVKYQIYDAVRNVTYTGWMWKDAAKRSKMIGVA